jgi:hypothetical protein
VGLVGLKAEVREMKAVRFVGVVGAMLAMSLVLAGPAAANVGISGSLSLPSAVAVGQTGQVGSFTVTNTNTAPQAGESNTLTDLRLAPSCGVVGTVASICSSPDPGVFSIASPASGDASTFCAGKSFTVSAPDVNGVVTFTPIGGAVAVPPPGGPAGNNQCKVNFTFSVLKMPALDSNVGLGNVQTRANLVATMQASPSGLMVTSRPTLEITVVRGIPTMTTQASRNAGAGTIADTATVTGFAGVAVPTGTVTFTVYGPNDATCTGAVFNSSTNALAAGVATSGAFPASLPGTYRFTAAYSGDANYAPVTAPCNAANENVTILSAPTVADFDGDGDTDRSVFRAGAWYAEGQATAFLGMSGDIPVPADYDGDGDANRAVYRSGAWFVDGQATVFLGVAGDIPVPGDYDGDGDAERAIYRPSVGGWYVDGQATVFFGLSTDIPVPGDYDGNGTVDRAVFRPSVGGWYVNGQGTVFLGLSGDIPVPGDYDGNGTTDRGIWRPSVGGWYVQSQATVFLGLSGDVPEPGDYDGNGTTDRGIWRPTVGGWYVQSQATVFLGINGDIPLPLPQAIYRMFF